MIKCFALKGLVQEGYSPIWQNILLTQDDGFNQAAKATARRLIIVNLCFFLCFFLALNSAEYRLTDNNWTAANWTLSTRQ